MDRCIRRDDNAALMAATSLSLASVTAHYTFPEGTVTSSDTHVNAGVPLLELNQD